ILATVISAQLVVRAHDAQHVRFLHGRLESRQINFAQRALIQLNVDRTAVKLLVVAGEVFYARGDAFALDALDVRYRHARREERVFAHVFEVPSVEWRALNVHAGAEHDVLSARPRFFADGLAIGEAQIRVPGGSQGDAHGQRGGEIVGVAHRLPGVGANVLAHAVGAVRHPPAGDA